MLLLLFGIYVSMLLCMWKGRLQLYFLTLYHCYVKYFGFELVFVCLIHRRGANCCKCLKCFWCPDAKTMFMCVPIFFFGFTSYVKWCDLIKVCCFLYICHLIWFCFYFLPFFKILFSLLYHYYSYTIIIDYLNFFSIILLLFAKKK